jgi:hypothetical protein
MIITIVSTILLLLVIFFPVIIAAGVIHEVTEYIKDGINAIGEFVGDLLGLNDSFNLDDEGNIIFEIPEDYDLSTDNPQYQNATPNGKAIADAAVAIVNYGPPYLYGGHPTGPGLDGIPPDGIDCAGFVMSAIWTGTGQSPGYLTTQAISDQIGTKFMEIDCKDMQAGDIGLKRRGGSVEGNTNHTGVYLGSGLWAHAAGKKAGVVISTYSNFTICLRYNG